MTQARKSLKVMALILILFVALGLRLPGILAGSFAFTYDMGRDLLAIRDLVTTRDIHLIGHTTGLIGVFYGPWWYWLLTIPFLLVAGNPIGMTTSIAVFGAIAAGVAFWWGRKTFGFVFGLTVGVLLAASPDIIKITNQLWNPHLLVLTTTLASILTQQFPRLAFRKLVLLGFFLGLLTEFEIVFGVLFLVGFSLAVFLFYRTYISLRTLGALVLGVAIVQAPRILFELRNGFVQTKAFVGTFGDSQSVWQLYTKRDWLIYGSLSSVLPGPPWVQNILVVAILVMLALYWRTLSKFHQRFVLTMLTIIAVFWTTTLIYPRDFWNHFMFGLPVLYAILIALIFSLLLRTFRAWTLVLLSIYFVALIRPVEIINSFRKPHFVGNAAVYRNQVEVVRALYNDSKTDFKYIAYTPPQFDYTWQYLFWLEEKKPHTFRLSEDPPIMYVIIEPDEDYPDRPKMWLEVRKNDGIVVAERKFPSGIVVQTRSLPSYGGAK